MKRNRGKQRARDRGANVSLREWVTRFEATGRQATAAGLKGSSRRGVGFAYQMRRTR